MKWISASLNFCVTCIKLTVLSMGVQGVHPRSLVTAWSVWCWRRGCTCDRKDVPVSASMVLEALHPTTFVYMGWSHDFPLQERGQVLDKLETPHDNCSLQAASSDPHRCRGRVSSTHLCVSQPMRMSSPLRATLSSGIHQKGQATQNAVGLKGKGVVKRQKAFHGGMQGRQEEREENMEGWWKRKQKEESLVKSRSALVLSWPGLAGFCVVPLSQSL